MSIAVLMQRLQDAGAPMEAIMIAVAAVEAAEAKHLAAEDARKASQRERTAKSRAKSRDGNVTVTSQQRDPSPKIYNSTPNHGSIPADPDGSATPTRRKPRNRSLPADWQPGERSEVVRQELGRSTEWMRGTAIDMRTWAESKGEVRADWDATHAGWMRREAKRECERGGSPGPRGQPPPGRGGGKPSSNGALSRVADLLGMPDEQRPEPQRNRDYGPVIDHQGDGRPYGQVHESAGGQPGRFSSEAYPRLVSAHGR